MKKTQVQVQIVAMMPPKNTSKKSPRWTYRHAVAELLVFAGFSFPFAFLSICDVISVFVKQKYVLRGWQIFWTQPRIKNRRENGTSLSKCKNHMSTWDDTTRIDWFSWKQIENKSHALCKGYTRSKSDVEKGGGRLQLKRLQCVACEFCAVTARWCWLNERAF